MFPPIKKGDAGMANHLPRRRDRNARLIRLRSRSSSRPARGGSLGRPEQIPDREAAYLRKIAEPKAGSRGCSEAHLWHDRYVESPTAIECSIAANDRRRENPVDRLHPPRKVGLFIVITGLETAVLTPELIAGIGALHLESVPVLTAFTALLSNLVSNVPAVLVLKPFITGLSDPQQAWLVAAMASTLAGNFTLVGSSANLIVAQRARSRGVTRRDRD
jgi:hypothetical protein